MMGYKPMPPQAQGMPQRQGAQFQPSPINFGQMGDIGQNIGEGMQGGQQAMQQRRMQQMLGPQSEAGWAMGTQVQPGQGRPMMGNMPGQAQGNPQAMWEMLRGRFGR